ncbi:MAG TPA: hypothetical protein VFW71_04615 [Actinomycetota bacterium]|nr:hypothetical protein [Actinomycetota bacterium]
MTATAQRALLLTGTFIVILLAVAVAFVHKDASGLRGAAIGAGVGLANLGVGALVTRRSLRKGMRSTMTMLMGGFLGRLLVLVGLYLVFEQTPSIDPAAFALTFLVFFFVYLGLELLMVERQRATAPPGAPPAPDITGSAA